MRLGHNTTELRVYREAVPAGLPFPRSIAHSMRGPRSFHPAAAATALILLIAACCTNPVTAQIGSVLDGKECAVQSERSVECGSLGGGGEMPPSKCCPGYRCSSKFKICEIDPDYVPFANITKEERAVEKAALENLFRQTNGTHWTHKGGWMDRTISICDWEGVDCNAGGFVSRVSLSGNGMSGHLDPLSDLTMLEEIDLSSNVLHGSLPNLGQSSLELISRINLAKNEFTGALWQIPNSLKYLDLSSNQLNGTFVQDTPTNLTHLNLADNDFEFIQLSQLGALQYLDLSKNEVLSQSLPDLGYESLVHLTTLLLYGTKGLTGMLNVTNNPNITHLDLNGMNLAGPIETTGVTNLVNLMYCDLGTAKTGGGNAGERNSFTGDFYFCNMTMLEHVSLAGNDLTSNGTAWGCGNLTELKYVNLSNNTFSGDLAGIGALEKLVHLDLGHNEFYGSIDEIRLLHNLKTLDLSDNMLSGALPRFDAPFMQTLNVSYNVFTSTIPETISSLEVLSELDLSHQRVSEFDPSTGERNVKGLVGTIPESIERLRFLRKLMLSHNLLSGGIPPGLSTLTYMDTLDLENNILGKMIPKQLDLLEGLESVLLANNQLTGTIPFLRGSRNSEKIRTITLSGNPDLAAPAPYSLCDVDDIDLRLDDIYCPRERSALAKFYEDTQGKDWLKNENWLNREKEHCTWHGVECSTDNKVTGLVLDANGLAGTLPAEIRDLVHLKKLDLNDNDLRGEVPAGIGQMTNLEFLRLSYNRFTKLPDETKDMKKLSWIYLQGNRLVGDDSNLSLAVEEDGDDSKLSVAVEGKHKFVTDCGTPTDAQSQFLCEGCDMCCNSLEECQEPLRPKVSGWPAAGLLAGGVCAGLLVFWVFLRVLVQHKIVCAPHSLAHLAAGEESVYSFLLARSVTGWWVAMATVAVQILLFGIFLRASDFDNGDGDFVYSYRCPRNSEECNDERAIGPYGWTMWACLVAAGIADDFANGIKLVLISSSRGSFAAFVVGLVVLTVTVLSVQTSLLYNLAIAVTQTELIVNAVILLFINDVDEQVFSICRIVNPKWVDRMSQKAEEYSESLHERQIAENDEDDDGSEKEEVGIIGSAPGKKVEEMKKQLERVQAQVDILMQMQGDSSGKEFGGMGL